MMPTESVRISTSGPFSPPSANHSSRCHPERLREQRLSVQIRRVQQA